MNYLAPRQGMFAVVLLLSFCLHLLVLLVSIERQQYEYRTDKGEKIVEQLSKEALVAVSNQDRISLSVLANRYQVDSDVARLTISNANQQTLVQTGVAQNATGQVIEQPIIQNNQKIGHVTVTMKALSSGEILAQQFVFILGSAVLHIFLGMIYGYMARPTKEQLQQIGEKIQQRIAITRQDMPTPVMNRSNITNDEAQQGNDESKPDRDVRASIQDYLQKNRQTSMDDTPNSHTTKNTITADNLAKENQIVLQIRFYDEFQLLERVAPDVAMPYLQLCQQLMLRACDSLFNDNTSVLNRVVQSVQLVQIPHFDKHGAVVHLTGKNEDVTLASVLLSKLMLILNQVVYEKHRELSRFALPMTAGVSMNQQFEDVQHLMDSHAREDGLLILLPKPLLKFLEHSVQYKHIPQPMSVIEREVVRYDGLSQVFMKDLIAKRDDILTSTERYRIG